MTDQDEIEPSLPTAVPLHEQIIVDQPRNPDDPDEPERLIVVVSQASVTPKSSVQHLSRRVLSTLPAAKPDGLWFRRDQPYHVRYTLPTDDHHEHNNRHSRSFRLQQTIGSSLLTFLCYAFLIFALPTVALIFWRIYREQTGGVIPLPGDNSTNSTIGSDLGNALP